MVWFIRYQPVTKIKIKAFCHAEQIHLPMISLVDQSSLNNEKKEQKIGDSVD